jgi:hypothetical protein
LRRPNTTGTTSMATSSTSPSASACPADIAGYDGDVAVAGEFPGDSDRAAHIVDEVAGRLGMPALRPRPVRHHNHVFTGRRSAFPPVRQVEEVPTHEGRPDALPRRPHVADRAPGVRERPTVDDRGVAIAVPLEKGTDVVFRVRDEAIHRDHGVHEYSAHNSTMFTKGAGSTWRHCI